MKKFIIVLFMLSIFSKISASENGSAYNYEFVGIDGNIIKLSDHIKDKYDEQLITKIQFCRIRDDIEEKLNNYSIKEKPRKYF